MVSRIGVVGAGWAGSSAAHKLTEAGHVVEVLERSDGVGGHSRCETLNGVVYEPNGAHIFHTSDPEIAAFVQRFGLNRPYAHTVLTKVFLSDSDEEGVLLSWPPQVEELMDLPIWNTISGELSALPSKPSGQDFESYVISMLGPTLYNLLVRDYTIKQWNMLPTELSSRFAPKRIELRRDGYRRLFRDRWEFFSADGINRVVERVLARVTTTLGAEIRAADLDDLAREYDALVITAPLDAFLQQPDVLAWRGIEMRSQVIPVQAPGETFTAGYVINHPSLRVPYTRTVETKHATGQQIEATVVSEEYPGSSSRHYPIPTPDRRFERVNEELKTAIRERSAIPVYFCGRLANYQYINQDQAIRQGFRVADDILKALS